MVPRTYSLTFKGYWRDVDSGGIPDQSGVYCVYACTYDPSSDKVFIRLLVYIGEADNVQKRIQGHEKRPAWEDHLASDEEMCFNFAPVQPASRERVEAALIFDHKPCENSEYVDSFPFDTTSVTTEGQNAKLSAGFTVYQTP